MLINIYICDKNAIKFPPFSLKCEIVILDCVTPIANDYFDLENYSISLHAQLV